MNQAINNRWINEDVDKYFDVETTVDILIEKLIGLKGLYPKHSNFRVESHCDTYLCTIVADRLETDKEIEDRLNFVSIRERREREQLKEKYEPND